MTDITAKTTVITTTMTGLILGIFGKLMPDFGLMTFIFG